MRRRDFLTATTVAGITAAAQAVKGDTVIPNEQDQTLNMANPERRRYVLVETYATQSVQKRDDLLLAFDSQLIADRNKLGFDKVGVFYVDTDLMSSDRSYDAKFFDSAVFVVQESVSLEPFLDLQRRTADGYSRFNLPTIFNLSTKKRPSCILLQVNRALLFLILTRIGFYNFARIILRITSVILRRRMFDQGELDLFRRCGMAPVFMGTAVFGTWIPNITYMLSFENDEARRDGWDMFVRHPEWRQMSQDPQYSRTATRIRNLFLRPSNGSQI